MSRVKPPDSHRGAESDWDSARRRNNDSDHVAKEP